MLLALALAPALWAQDGAGTFDSTWWRADADELHYYWVPDLALTGGLFAGYFTFHGVQPRDVGGVAEPSGLDAAPTPRWDDKADAWSDLLGLPLANAGLNLPVVATLGAGVWGGIRDRSVGAGAVHTLVVLESYGATVAVTEALKVAIARPRPYTAAAFADAHPDVAGSQSFQANFTEDESWDAYKSMPSGHTSGTAAYSFSIATLVWRDASLHGRGSPAGAAAYGTAGALTATVGALRVVAGRHHVTDTVVGGLLGAGIGTGLTWLHTSRAGLSAEVGEDGVPMLVLSGAW